MGTPPKHLNSRHHVIKVLYAAGWTQRRIAEELGYTEARVSTICSSDLFRVEVEKLQRELAQSSIADAVDLIAQEAKNSVKTIIELRDHAETESVRMTSAFGLLDRNPETARRSKQEEERTVRIVLGREDLTRLVDVAAEVGELVVPQLPPPTATPTIKARTLDEALDAMQQERER